VKKWINLANSGKEVENTKKTDKVKSRVPRILPIFKILTPKLKCTLHGFIPGNSSRNPLYIRH
jgi:hypothetical protein